MTDASLPASTELLDTDLLNVFCCVARTQNFSRAALQLDTAQPVVSRKVVRLEEELGVKLFVRTNRGCDLTHAGELLAAKVPGILSQIAQLKAEVSNSTDVVSGLISMGITNSAATFMAPHLLPQIARRWPRLRVNLVEAVSRSLCDKVLNRELPLAVLHDPPGETDLVTTPLLVERVCLVGSPSIYRQELRQPTVRDLAQLPLILPSGNQTIRNLLEDAFAEIGETIKPVYEATSVNMLRAMAAEGLGYTVLTLGSVADDIVAGKLVARPLAEKGMSVVLTLVSTREHSRLRNVNLLSKLVSDEIRRVARQGLWPGKPIIIRD